MNCSDLKTELALYADRSSGGAAVKDHLAFCPVCRSTLAEHLEVRSDLSRMRRPELAAFRQDLLKDAVRAELRSEKASWLPVSSNVRDWLQMQVMPYGVGAIASLAIAVSFLGMMFSGMMQPGDVNIAKNNGGSSSIMLASNSNPFAPGDRAAISAPEFARSRTGYAAESPSVNPQGALVALTRSLVRGGMKDDEVVVVADVFSNGLAQIAEVVEPSRDTRAVGELEKALESDPKFAPFVPSTIENRPDSVRVVLRFQSVNVKTGDKPRRQ